MKAMLLEKPGPVTQQPLRLADVPVPTPGAGEVLIRVRACGICRTDLHIVEGELPVRKSPLIPGHQIVGEVVQGAGGQRAPIVDGDPLTPTLSRGERERTNFAPGTRVGVAWLHRTCGACRFCVFGRENLCERAEFTGWTRDGGYAEYVVAPAEFIYRLPQSMSDEQAAPLLCAGIIGFRCLNQCQLFKRRGAKIGMYGFGAAAHISIQIARAGGAAVYVFTRDRQRHQKLAGDLGAAWVGDTFDSPPPGVVLDAAIIFAPAGEIVPAALKALDRGGRLVLAGIHMSDIPAMPYSHLYWERHIVSVANNTHADGRLFLEVARRIGVTTHVQSFPLEKANEALIALKHDAIRGAGVLVI